MADIAFSGSGLTLPIGAEAIYGIIPRTPISSPPGSPSFLRAINLGGPTSTYGDCPMGRNLIRGITQSRVEGSPAVPSLQITYGFWRFRWVVKSGNRTISINTKQSASISPRPSMIVKANKDIGITQDLSGSAAVSSDWVTIGPVAVTATSTGATWVELWNNQVSSSTDYAYFDHIVVT
jgi:hypothetical protein